MSSLLVLHLRSHYSLSHLDDMLGDQELATSVGVITALLHVNAKMLLDPNGHKAWLADMKTCPPVIDLWVRSETVGGNRGERDSVTNDSHMCLKQIIYVLAFSKILSSILVLWVVRVLFHANTLRFIGCFWFLHSLLWKIFSLKVHSKYCLCTVK